MTESESHQPRDDGPIARLAESAARTRDRIPRDCPEDVRAELQGLEVWQWKAQYVRLTEEIGHQLNRRSAFTAEAHALLGRAGGLLLGAFTAAALVGQPLIGLYGCAAAAFLPLLMYSLQAEREHADLRLGQLQTWLALYEKALPDGMGWDRSRREAFPAQAGADVPALAQPARLLRAANRLLIISVDGAALALAAIGLVGTLAVGPWWTWLTLVPGVALWSLSLAVTELTWRVSRHDRVRREAARPDDECDSQSE